MRLCFSEHDFSLKMWAHTSETLQFLQAVLYFSLFICNAGGLYLKERFQSIMQGAADTCGLMLRWNATSKGRKANV